MHAGAVALGAAVALGLTACGGGSDSGMADNAPTSASPASKGVVTKATAEKILDTYEKVNNRANRTQDAKLLSTVEAGQVNAQSRADYKQWDTWSKKEQKRYGSPFFYTNRKYYIPTAGSGASWFAVQGTSSSEKAKSLVVFDKVGGTYKMVAAVWFDKDETIPKVAVDRNGHATPVDPSKRVGALAPDQLGDTFVDLLETGGKKSGAQLASTPAVRTHIKWHKERNKSTAEEDLSWRTLTYVAADPAHPKVYALRLADGGVLAAFPSAYKAEFLHKQYMSGGRIIPGPAEAVYNSAERPVVVDEYQGQAIAALSPNSKPRVLAFEDEMVASR
ncbi:hypothetical protein ACWD26_29865 [Streptomyces sp. NPDC002787]